MTGRLSRALRRVGSWIAAIGRKMPGLLCDFSGYAGAAAISYGAWLIYEPAGFIIGGILLIAGAFIFGRRFGANS